MFWKFLALALAIYLTFCFVVQFVTTCIELKKNIYEPKKSLTLLTILMALADALVVVLFLE